MHMKNSIQTSRLLLSITVFFLLAMAAFAIDVSETTLPNGLKVLIREVHAAPIVVVDVWYKTGSRNDIQGLTGASHLLEHMTYKGSKEFGKDDMRNLTKRNGAIDNGATYYDFTHYYTTIASDRLPLVLRMEASRMSTALINQHDLDSEMTVVRSELEGRDNNPGSLLFKQLMASAYSVHAYRWPVIGWRADIEHITAAQLRQYYKSHYMPNNATLVVVGDVNTEQALREVRQYFGKLKRGVLPDSWVTPEPVQQGERQVMVRQAGQVPIEMLAWHIPAITHQDIPALLMLDQVLGTGRLSRLYSAIVEKQMGISAYSSVFMQHDPGLFTVAVATSPGQALAPVETSTLEQIVQVKTTPPSAGEMARGLRQLQASTIYARDDITQQAEELGENETVAGSWRFSDQLLEQIKKVTPDDVSRVARLYLTDNNRTIAIFQPSNGKSTTALPLQPSPFAYADASLSSKLARTGATTGVTAPKTTAKRQRFVLPNGMVLVVQENHSNPTIAISASLRAGKAYDPAGKTGVADMVANLLDRGTTTRSSQQIAVELEGAAAEISSGTGWETVGLHGKALRDDSGLLLRNLADLLRNATFPIDEITKMREQMLSAVAMERDEPSSNAYRNFYRALYPVGHPYRLPSFDEEISGLKSITQEDLQHFYQTRYTPKTLILAVVGDVDPLQVKALVEQYFNGWQGDMPALLSFPTQETYKSDKVVTTIQDKTEVNIYVGHPGGLLRTSPDYYAAEVMNMILGGGGALNSRLGDVIRDQHGLAYSVYSDFHASTGSGPWYAMLGVNPKNVDQAVSLLQQQIVLMQEKGATEQEVKDAQSYLTGSYAISLNSNAALASSLMDAEYFQLGLDYIDRAPGLFRAVTREQVNAAAKRYLHPEALTISIAGSYPVEK